MAAKKPAKKMEGLSPCEEWAADSILALDLPLEDLPQAIAAAYGSGVNHQAIIDEVLRRRGS